MRRMLLILNVVLKANSVEVAMSCMKHLLFLMNAITSSKSAIGGKSLVPLRRARYSLTSPRSPRLYLGH